MISALLLGLASPVFDVHRHGNWPWSDTEGARSRSLTEMSEHDVKSAVVAATSFEEIDAWSEVGDNVLVGVMLPCPENASAPFFHCFPEDEGWPDLERLEAEILAGRVHALHEVLPSYSGISPADPRLDPYFALAHKHQIPVGVHTTKGPPAGGRFSIRDGERCCALFDGEMGNPALLRPVLDRYPGMKVWLQHVGAGMGDYGPFWPETLELLRDYPDVYIDLSITNGVMPMAQYEAALAHLISNGFESRIMLGSDGVPMQRILERLNSIDWLTAKQRSAILYDNAHCFFASAE